MDRDALDALHQLEEQGAEGLFDRVLDAYFSSSPELIATLREAVAAGDVEAVRNAAHALKAASTHLGAVTVAELAGSLEAMARRRSIDQAAALVAALEPEFDQVRLALETERSGLVN